MSGKYLGNTSVAARADLDALVTSLATSQGVNVRTYGAKGDGTTDDSAAIQAAINAAASTFTFVLVPSGNYRCHGLTAPATGFLLFAPSGPGYTNFIKNANGPILTCSGQDAQIHGLSFRGEASTPVFTGDNVVFTGNNCALINCTSLWAFGRAVKATGNQFVILGHGDIYQTADASATGYDIEIGVSGTATLYHQIWGVYTSQKTGGILLVDTGAAQIFGGEFGKLYIKKGTGPAGSGGGMTVGARITGDVTIEAPNASFSANQFATVNIVLAAGTTGCNFDPSNLYENGVSFVNNGGPTNFIERTVNLPAEPTLIATRLGDDASLALMRWNPATGRATVPADFAIKDTQYLLLIGADGVTNIGTLRTAGGNVGLDALGAAVLALETGTGPIQLFVNGVQKFVASTTGIGFYSHAAIAQAVLATGAGHTVDDVITALQNLGLVKQT